MAAKKELMKGRNTTGISDAQIYYKTKEVSNETLDVWTAFIKNHRPPLYCLEKKIKTWNGKGDEKGDLNEDEKKRSW